MFKILALSLTLLLPPFAPQRIHALLHLCFLGIVSCIPKLRISRFFGHKFLTDKVARIIVGLFVATAVTHLLHQFGGRIAQMQRHRHVSRLFNILQRRIDCHICRIAFG